MDSEVIESISRSLSENWHNPSSQQKKGKEAKNILNESRRAVANMINANSDDVIFTSGGTEVFFYLFKFSSLFDKFNLIFLLFKLIMKV